MRRICLVGLGNPGARYENTRHNIGFMWVDRIVDQQNLEWSAKFSSLWAQFKTAECDIHLLKPQTYMNLSGRALREWKAKFQGESEVVAIVDDLDLPLGKLRLREKGGSAGHNGMKSLMEVVSGEQLPRLRLGIGRPADPHEVSEFVLQKFKPAERKTVDEVLSYSSDFVERLAKEGLAKTMNFINTISIEAN